MRYSMLSGNRGWLGFILLLASVPCLATGGYDWSLPGPDGSDPTAQSDPLDPLHRLLAGSNEEILFGEVSYLAASRMKEEETVEDETPLAASETSWLFGGSIGEAADWILLGRLRQADAEDGGDRIDPGYLEQNESLLRFALKPTSVDRVRITGRYGRIYLRPDAFYERSLSGVANGPLEQREGEYVDLHWSRSISARSLLRMWTHFAEDEWSLGAAQGGDDDSKPPSEYTYVDFDGYSQADQHRIGLAGDLTLESWLSHRLVSGFHLQGWGIRSTEGRVEEPDAWPRGANQAWEADADAWWGRVFVADRWQSSGQLVVEPHLAWLRYQLTEPREYFTPRLRLVVSPADNTIVSARMGIDVRPPSFSYMAERAANDYTTDLWGDPERDALEPEKSREVELGVEQIVLEDLSLGLTARYRWIEDVILGYDLWGLSYDPDPRTSKYYYWNGAEATAWSLETELRRRMSPDLSASAQYVLGRAIGRLAGRPEWLANQSTVAFAREFYLDWDVRHRVKLAVDYSTARLGGLAARIVWAWSSGTPYTPHGIEGFEMSDGPFDSEPAEFNSRRLPDWNELNLLVTKDLRLTDDVDLALNVQVENVLDHRNIREINNDTGEPEPQERSGNTGSPRTFRAGLVLKF